jgi:hypothetical protein
MWPGELSSPVNESAAMKRILWIALLLAAMSSGAAAQVCQPPSQACAAGRNGWGGCFLPGRAVCDQGLICDAGTSPCPRGAKGAGGCFDPRANACDDGAITARATGAPAADRPSDSPASTACTTMAGGDRRDALDVIRQPVSRDLRTHVEFVVERARVCGAFAFVLATPRRPDGRAMRWAGTPCAGDTSHLVGALLRRGPNGWLLAAYALCPSDVAWEDWPDRFGAPAEIFAE